MAQVFAEYAQLEPLLMLRFWLLVSKQTQSNCQKPLVRAAPSHLLHLWQGMDAYTQWRALALLSSVVNELQPRCIARTQCASHADCRGVAPWLGLTHSLNISVRSVALTSSGVLPVGEAGDAGLLGSSPSSILLQVALAATLMAAIRCMSQYLTPANATR